MSQFRDLYLCFYNLFQAFGWALSLLRILSSFFSTNSTNGAFSSAGNLICLLQSVAFLEVIHGAIGIVPSGVLLPLMQWARKTHFVFAVVWRIREIQELPAVFITFCHDHELGTKGEIELEFSVSVEKRGFEYISLNEEGSLRLEEAEESGAQVYLNEEGSLRLEEVEESGAQISLNEEGSLRLEEAEESGAQVVMIMSWELKER